MEAINFSLLTPEQKAEIKAQLAAEEAAEKARAKQQRSDYEALKEAQINETFTALTNVSTMLEKVKDEVFKQFSSVLDMKQELYGLTDVQMELQQSHTFTTTDGGKSIIIGSNVIDNWSDDVRVGVDKVNAWIEKKIADDQSREIIRELLKPDKDGYLKANRILDLSRKANEMGDKELIDAVNFIRDQYRPVKTSTYVKVKYTDEEGRTKWLPLSMSAV